MSRSLNEVTLVGNVGADPEIRTTHGGRKVAMFTLGTTRYWNEGAERKEKTEWHRCVAYNPPRGLMLADVASKLKAGDTVLVKGRLEYREYEAHGAKHVSVEIMVGEMIAFWGRRGARDRDGRSGDTSGDDQP